MSRMSRVLKTGVFRRTFSIYPVRVFRSSAYFLYSRVRTYSFEFLIRTEKPPPVLAHPRCARRRLGSQSGTMPFILYFSHFYSYFFHFFFVSTTVVNNKTCAISFDCRSLCFSLPPCPGGAY